MNFITMLCLALANCEQFMSLSKAEDHGVSARSDLAEIDDLNLTAPSPLQRLLSSADDDEEEEDDEEKDEDEEDEEADEDESEVEDGKKVWSTPQVAGVGVGGAILGVGGVYACQYFFGAKPPQQAQQQPVEPTITLIMPFEDQAAATKYVTDKKCKSYVHNSDGEADSYKVEMTLQQLKELPAWKTFTEALGAAGFTIATEPAKEPETKELTEEEKKAAEAEKNKAKDDRKGGEVPPEGA